ncbi:MAG: hypothetical protein AAFP19_01715, partial [Bacteroidota bacterium]
MALLTSTHQKSFQQFLMGFLLFWVFGNAQAQNIAILLDPSYGPTSTSCFNEYPNTLATYQELGFNPTIISDISPTDLAAGLIGQDVLVIPETESGNFANDLSPAAATIIQDFVASGNGLIMHGSGGASTGNENLNAIFGFNISYGGGTTSGVSTLNTVQAQGTSFEGCVPTIPNLNAVYLLTGSLPADTKCIYERNSTQTSVALIPFGSGEIAYLGWDWFNGGPGCGFDGSDWETILQKAVMEVAFGSLDCEVTVSRAILFQDQANFNYWEQALVDQGIPYTDFGSNVFRWNLAVGEADPQTDIVIVNNVFGMTLFGSTNLPDFINNGGRVIFYSTIYRFDFELPAVLEGIFAASVFVPFDLYDWGGSDLFNGVSSPMRFNQDFLPVDAVAINLSPTSSGALVAGYSPTVNDPNQGAILIGNSGRTILNGISINAAASAADAIALANNQLELLGAVTISNGSELVCPPNQTVEGCSTADITNGGLVNLPFSSNPTTITESELDAEGGSVLRNCMLASISYQDSVAASGSCITTITRTYTAIDSTGTSFSCEQMITIEDTTDPVASCQDITVELDANGQATISSDQLNNGSSDNCTPASDLIFLPSRTSFSCTDLNNNCEGSVPVFILVRDSCGNQDSCAVNVFIEDNIAPIFSHCPGNLTFTLDPGACQFIYDFDLAATDNCDADVELRQIAGPPSGTALDHTTTTTYTFEAEDNCGNVAICSYTVTIVEFPNPTTSLTCNNRGRISLDASCTATVGADDILEGGPYACYDDYLLEIFYDSLMTQAVPTSPILTADDVGRVIWVRVTDPETENSCWGSLLVEEKIIPQLGCSDAVALCYEDIAPEALGFPLGDTVVITANPDGTYRVQGFDSCSDALLSFVDSEELLECEDINQVITRLWTITDEFGNQTNCTQRISLERATLSDITLPRHYDGLDLPMLNCDERCDPNDNQFCGPTDLYWNVLPADHPFAGHPSPFDELWPCGTVKCRGTGFPDAENCGEFKMTFEDTRINACTSGASDGCFTIIREWTILDKCTREVLRFDQVIEVQDDEGPEIQEVADLTISTDVWRCEADWLATLASVSDNCSIIESDYVVEASSGIVEQLPNGRWLIRDLPLGAHTISYIATDCCGNEGRKDIVLTVVDDVAPVAVCDAFTEVSLSGLNV